MVKKKRKLAPAGAIDEPPSAPVAECNKNAAAKIATAAVSPAEDRLAAFGEAFMNSIDRPAPRPRVTNPPQQVARASGVEPERRKDGSVIGLPGAPGLAGEGKKRRRNKAKNRARERGEQDEHVEKASKGGVAPAASPTGLAPVVRSPANTAFGATFAPKVAGLAPQAKPPQMTARDRRDFMSGKVSAIRSSRKDAEVLPGKGHGKGGRTEEDAEFQKTLREVVNYVTPLLGKRERQQFEDSKVRALGGTIEREKMPYKRFQLTIKENKAKRARLVEEDKLAGVEMSANAYKASWVVDSVLKKKKEALKDKKKRQEDGINRLGMGARERNGMATIPRAAIKNMQRGGI